MDLTLLDTMLQKLGMSYQTISGKKHFSINLRVKKLLEWQLMSLQLLCMILNYFHTFLLYFFNIFRFKKN
jgi:hypothetical protein